MRNRYFLGIGIILAILTSLAPVRAAVHEGSLILGLTTAPDDTGFFQVVDQPLGPMRVYLVVYGYDHPQGIVSWDCALLLPPGLQLLTTRFAGGGWNAHPQPENFRVTTQTPLQAVDGMILLATLDLLVLDGRDLAIGLGPDPAWGNDGMMGFARETMETIREPLNWPRSCPGCPVFELTHSQADAYTSWESLKALYRP